MIKDGWEFPELATLRWNSYQAPILRKESGTFHPLERCSVTYPPKCQRQGKAPVKPTSCWRGWVNHWPSCSAVVCRAKTMRFDSPSGWIVSWWYLGGVHVQMWRTHHLEITFPGKLWVFRFSTSMLVYLRAFFFPQEGANLTPARESSGSKHPLWRWVLLHFYQPDVKSCEICVCLPESFSWRGWRTFANANFFTLHPVIAVAPQFSIGKDATPKHPLFMSPGPTTCPSSS